MLDIQNSLAHPLVIRREDYTPPEWLVPDTKLAFDLDPATTRVTATLSVTRNGDHAAPLRLDGAGQKPLSVTVDGVAINDWRIDGEQLVIPLTGAAHVV